MLIHRSHNELAVSTVESLKDMLPTFPTMRDEEEDMSDFDRYIAAEGVTMTFVVLKGSKNKADVWAHKGAETRLDIMSLDNRKWQFNETADTNIFSNIPDHWLDKKEKTVAEPSEVEESHLELASRPKTTDTKP